MRMMYVVAAIVGLVAFYLSIHSELARPRTTRQWWPGAALMSFALLAFAFALWSA